LPLLSPAFARPSSLAVGMASLEKHHSKTFIKLRDPHPATFCRMAMQPCFRAFAGIIASAELVQRNDVFPFTGQISAARAALKFLSRSTYACMYLASFFIPVAFSRNLLSVTYLTARVDYDAACSYFIYYKWITRYTVSLLSRRYGGKSPPRR